MKAEHKIFALKAIDQAGGAPLPETALKASLKLAFGHERWTESDLEEVITELESVGYVVGTKDEFAGRLWVLTARGKLRVKQWS